MSSLALCIGTECTGTAPGVAPLVWRLPGRPRRAWSVRPYTAQPGSDFHGPFDAIRKPMAAPASSNRLVAILIATDRLRQHGRPRRGVCSDDIFDLTVALASEYGSAGLVPQPGYLVTVRVRSGHARSWASRMASPLVSAH